MSSCYWLTSQVIQSLDTADPPIFFREMDSLEEQSDPGLCPKLSSLSPKPCNLSHTRPGPNKIHLYCLEKWANTSNPAPFSRSRCHLLSSAPASRLRSSPAVIISSFISWIIHFIWFSFNFWPNKCLVSVLVLNLYASFLTFFATLKIPWCHLGFWELWASHWKTLREELWSKKAVKFSWGRVWQLCKQVCSYIKCKVEKAYRKVGLVFG